MSGLALPNRLSPVLTCSMCICFLFFALNVLQAMPFCYSSTSYGMQAPVKFGGLRAGGAGRENVKVEVKLKNMNNNLQYNEVNECMCYPEEGRGEVIFALERRGVACVPITYLLYIIKKLAMSLIWLT